MVESPENIYTAEQPKVKPEACAWNAIGFSSKFGQWTRRLKAGAQRMKEQEPLRSLGLIATIGLALGIAIRLWRSRCA